MIDLICSMVLEVSFNFKDPTHLFKMATKAGLCEFLSLIESVVLLLTIENRKEKNLQVTGKLARVRTGGEVIVVGDIHGDFESLLNVLKRSSFLKKAQKDENVLLLFLGDYGDRGIYSPEVYYATLKLKEEFPGKVILMRGNHEGPDDLLPYPHDLPLHLQRKFGGGGSEAYVQLRTLFNHLCIAALIDDRYVLLHGGVPSKASSLDDLAYANEKHPMESHLQEILWSDPRENIEGTYPSPRGAGRLFGEDVTIRFLELVNVNLLIRGHEPSEEGFRLNHRGKVLTIFSRTGPPYYNSFGAYLQLDLSESVNNGRQIKRFIHKF